MTHCPQSRYKLLLTAGAEQVIPHGCGHAEIGALIAMDDAGPTPAAPGAGYRVYFTRRGEVVYLLLCGGTKASQARDIKRANQMLKLL